uniref:Uncharacterized protein n=1 Tax=Romanomermis culicivorax TaxID=13658 RepID=A0A915HIY1_ROMCU
MQFNRLDSILGKAGSGNKDVYESKISLASRIVKVERQVSDINAKLDILLELCGQNRLHQRQNLEETSDSCTSKSPKGKLTPPPAKTTDQMVKSILNRRAVLHDSTMNLYDSSNNADGTDPSEHLQSSSSPSPPDVMDLRGEMGFFDENVSIKSVPNPHLLHVPIGHHFPVPPKYSL